MAHNGGLAASGTYPGSYSGEVPALSPGNYYLLVQVDSLYQTDDTNRANNVWRGGTSRSPCRSRALTLGSPAGGPLTATLDQYYQVTVPPAGRCNSR